MHDIRLVAGFEVKTGPIGQRILNKVDCQALGDALAEDLARVASDAGRGTLVIVGSLFEPGELLRPGFPAWQALEDLFRPLSRESQSGGQIMAIGAHDKRFPDARLCPPANPPAGQFLALPLTLISDRDTPGNLTERLERDLFERGGIHPPAQSILANTTGLEIVHGQLMTLNDLIALQHVQMDTAGLGPFWPVVELALVEPLKDHEFDLPGSLTAHWEAGKHLVEIDFVTFDQFDGDVDSYALWTRAFRSLSTLLELHAMPVKINSALTHDRERQCLVESVGPIRCNNGLTEQIHADCGLLAWTLVEDQRQFNLYPLTSDGFGLLKNDFKQRGLYPRRSNTGLTTDPANRQLIPHE